MSRNPRFMTVLRQMAKDNAEGEQTGWLTVASGQLKLAYYPVSDRYQWFSTEGPIPMKQALKWLTSTARIEGN